MNDVLRISAELVLFAALAWICLHTRAGITRTTWMLGSLLMAIFLMEFPDLQDNIGAGSLMLMTASVPIAVFSIKTGAPMLVLGAWCFVLSLWIPVISGP